MGENVLRTFLHLASNVVVMVFPAFIAEYPESSSQKNDAD
jgi:hypothetical protein